jgi:hypothetical protein
MTRSLKSYLPAPGQQRDNTMVILNARVPLEMRENLKKFALRNKWKPSEVIRASIQKFIDDERVKSA